MKPVSENACFVTLIQIAEEDPEVRGKLLEILSHPSVHRRAVLHFYIAEMNRKGAPEDFVSAVACLLQDAVADRARSLLRNKEYGTGDQRVRSRPPRR
ncbi:MAG: hypothetical protein PVG78_11365 [Desulfobacterales bacterium]|jgi:hypothetical protein